MADNKAAGGMDIDTKLVRELAKLLADTDLSEIEVEDGHKKIRVARTLSAAPMVQHVAAPTSGATQTSAAPTLAATPADPAADMLANAVKSPMVGTVYLAPEPDAPQFAAIGATVKEGDTILIIEAMKVMNAITAPRGGTLAAILVSNDQPVEFDQPLFVIS
jgi:acetyl-CoA carboxylase biotin carboxyl carrier protein